jgi:hypothetical protein
VWRQLAYASGWAGCPSPGPRGHPAAGKVSTGGKLDMEAALAAARAQAQAQVRMAARW